MTNAIVNGAGRMTRMVGLSPIIALSFTVVLAAASAGWAQNRVTEETAREQDLSAQSAAKHHYSSPAERAQDDLLIVKVKAAMADSGLADSNPMTVDADHGRVTVTGVLASREDVDEAVGLIAGIQGVKGVNNRLTWEKNPESSDEADLNSN